MNVNKQYTWMNRIDVVSLYGNSMVVSSFRKQSKKKIEHYLLQDSDNYERTKKMSN